MKLNLTGFKYYLDKVELKDYDEFEKKIEKLDVETKLDMVNKKVHARTRDVQ